MLQIYISLALILITPSAIFKSCRKSKCCWKWKTPPPFKKKTMYE